MTVVDIRGLVYIQNPPGNLLKEAKGKLQIPNPDAAKAARFGSRFGAAHIPPTLYGYSEDAASDCLIVPRAFYFAHLLPLLPPGTTIRDNTASHRVEWPEPRISLMEHQLPAADAFCGLVNANDAHRRPTDSVIVMAASSGKTVLGLFLCRDVGERTLVVVPTQEIEEGWVEQANKVYGIPPSDIGRIRAKEFIVGRHLTVASLQTVMKMPPKDWAQVFGMVIVDELHRAAASVMENALKNSAALIRLGLTATPTRKDGRMPVVRWHLGLDVHRDETPRNSVPIVYHGILTTYQPPAASIVDGQKQWDYGKILDKVGHNPHRDQLIVSLIAHIFAKYPGDILITSLRIEHIDALAALLTPILGKAPAVLTGKSVGRKALLAEIKAGKHRVTIGMQSVVSDGVSNPRWHHVIVTMPFSDPGKAVQIAGRPARRSETSDNVKDFGHFWHLVDDCPMTLNMGRTIYRALKRNLHSSETLTARRAASSYTFHPASQPAQDKP